MRKVILVPSCGNAIPSWSEELLELRGTLAYCCPMHHSEHGDVFASAKWSEVEMDQGICLADP